MVASGSLGARLNYRKYGEGPALVILHGFLGSSGNWHSLASGTFGQHFSTFAVDQRNHGDSPHADEIDYGLLAGDLRAFLDAQDIDRAHVLGHSMGGKAAMEFALSHGNRLNRLVVADVAPRSYPPYHLDILYALQSVDLATVASRGDVDAALASHILSKPVRQFLLKNLSYDSDSKTYAWAANIEVLDALYENLNAEIAGGREFDGPTLFVRGGKSSYVGAEDEGAIKQRFPAARIETIESAGHWVHADAADEFGAVVLDFLRQDA